MPTLVDQRSFGFPETMCVVANDNGSRGNVSLASIERDNVCRHNSAVHDFIKAGVGATNNLRTSERVILTMCAAFETWCGDPEASTGYGAEHITFPIYNALVNMLNLDCGRLDCGSLSAWLITQCERVGMDPDTGGDWVPGNWTNEQVWAHNNG